MGVDGGGAAALVQPPTIAFTYPSRPAEAAELGARYTAPPVLAGTHATVTLLRALTLSFLRGDAGCS